MFYNFVSGWIKKQSAKISFGIFFVKIGLALKILSFNNDISQCKVPRAKVLWQEAIRRGIEMRELLLFGKPFDCYIASYKQKAISCQLVFSGLPRSEESNNSRLDLMDDKAVFKLWLEKEKIPVSKGGSVWSFNQAKKVFKRIQKPVIVKPRAGSRGRHSTTFVDTEAELRKAFKIAKKLCFWVMVEEQLLGPVYRATLINFELCGVLRGDPPQVMGDGERSIRELISIKNREKPSGVKDIVIDEGMGRFIERQISNQSLNFKAQTLNPIFNYIPKRGEIVSLSEKIGLNYGGSSREDYEICHSDNKELFVATAKVVSDPIVGFDFIIPDITKSWKEQRCGFIEANSLPFINLHHYPLLGKPRNVAAKVWDMMGVQ